MNLPGPVNQWFSSQVYQGGAHMEVLTTGFSNGMRLMLFGDHQWGDWSSMYEWAAFNRLYIKWSHTITPSGWYITRYDTKYMSCHFYTRSCDGWYYIADRDGRPDGIDGYAYGPFKTLESAVIEVEGNKNCPFHGKLHPLERAWITQFIKQYELKWSVSPEFSVDNFIHPKDEKEFREVAATRRDELLNNNLTVREKIALGLSLT
jgi:hypothetical protein